MKEMVQHIAAALPAVPAGWRDGLHAALMAIQEPGFLDRAGAVAIGLFVLACWLFAPSARRG